MKYKIMKKIKNKLHYT